MKANRNHAALAVIILLASGCASVPSSLESGHLKDDLENISTRRYVRVRGIAVAPDDVSDTTRRRAASRQAALALARKELLGVVGGLRVTGRVLVGDAMLIDQRLKEEVDSLVAAAEVAKTEWAADDSCVVVLQIRRREVEKLKTGIKKSDLPPPLPKKTRRFWKTASARERRRREYRSPSPNRGRMFQRLMPWTKGFLDDCRKDKVPGAVVLNCGTGGLLSMGLSLGMYPIGADLIALPFRLIAMPFKSRPAR